MAEDVDEIRRGFIAERRNLLITSIALFLVQYSKITFDEINILGNKASIKDPWVLTFLLWVLWFYFALRFYQYSRAHPDKRTRAEYDSKLHRYLVDVGRDKIRRVYVVRQDYAEFPHSFRFGALRIEHLGAWNAVLKIPTQIEYNGGGGKVHVDSFNSPIDVPFNRLLLPRLRSCLHVALNTHFGTEYILPYVVASLPLIYCLFPYLGIV